MCPTPCAPAPKERACSTSSVRRGRSTRSQGQGLGPREFLDQDFAETHGLAFCVLSLTWIVSPIARRGACEARGASDQQDLGNYGAPGRTRTSTMSPPTDFESAASTNSATGARRRIIAAHGGGSTAAIYDWQRDHAAARPGPGHGLISKSCMAFAGGAWQQARDVAIAKNERAHERA